MRYEVSAVVHDSPERVYAWWTDYGPVGSSEKVSHGFGRAVRHVVRADGNVVELEERVAGIPLVRHRVELHPDRLAFRERGNGFEAWWAFEKTAEGTRIRREIVSPPLPRKLVRKFAQRDLEHHCQEYEESNLK